MAFSTYQANEFLDHMLRNSSAPTTTTVHVSLHTDDPGNTGANEADYTGYAREAVASGFAVAASKTTDNDSAITFGTNTGSAQTVTHVGMFDTNSGGNFMIGGSLTASTQIGVNGIPQFAAGALDVTLT
jgi:hypothetical protein